VKSRSYNVSVNDRTYRRNRTHIKSARNHTSMVHNNSNEAHHMSENTFVPPTVNKQPEVTKTPVVKPQLKPPILQSSTPITPRNTVTGVSNDTRTEDVWTTPSSNQSIPFTPISVYQSTSSQHSSAVEVFRLCTHSWDRFRWDVLLTGVFERKGMLHIRDSTQPDKLGCLGFDNCQTHIHVNSVMKSKCNFCVANLKLNIHT
jgi:hypothetical protein